MKNEFRMPLGSLTRESVLRGVAVVVITGAVTLAAACSDEDVVNTIPPPRPDRSTSSVGPTLPPGSEPSSPAPVSTTTTTP